MLAPAFAGDNPRSIHERRLMPHMLPMAAGQIGHPVAMFIQMISNNGLVHATAETNSIRDWTYPSVCQTLSLGAGTRANRSTASQHPRRNSRETPPADRDGEILKELPGNPVD